MMGRTFKKNKPPISQPLNFVHHVGPAEHGNQPIDNGAKGIVYGNQLSDNGAKGIVFGNQPSDNGAKGIFYGNQSSERGAKGNLYVDQPTAYETPMPQQNKLPPPCPGPSTSGQSTGATGLDQRMLETITCCVTETVRRELKMQLDPVRDTVQQLLVQTSKRHDTAERQTGNQSFSAEDKSREYVNFEDGDSPEVRSEFRSRTSAARLSNVANPIYSRQPEELPVVFRPKAGTKPSLPGQRPHVTPDRLRRDNPGRVYRNVSFNERDCYAKALRTHIEEIVETTLFTETELPDALISGGCLTEDECRTIREKVDRKDQIRILVAVIKTRDLKVLTQFLDFLERDNKSLVQKINESVDNNINNGFRERRCSLCKLKGQVNVKYVADKLWAEGCIPDELYNQLIFTEKPTGAQDKQWERILDSFAAMGTLGHAFETLLRFLRDRGHYSHLADELEKMVLDTVKRTACFCNIQVRMTTKVASSSSSLEPKSTDLSSTEILDDEFSPRHSSEELLEEGIKDYETIGNYSRDGKQKSSKDGTNVNRTKRPALLRGFSNDAPPPPLPVKTRSLPREMQTVRTTTDAISTKRADHDISTNETPVSSFMGDSWTNRTTKDNPKTKAMCTSRTWPKTITDDTPMALTTDDITQIRTKDDISLIKATHETQMVTANNNVLATKATNETAMVRSSNTDLTSKIANDTAMTRTGNDSLTTTTQITNNAATTKSNNEGLVTKATSDSTVDRPTDESSPIGIINATRTNITTNDILTTKATNNTPPMKLHDDTHKVRSTNDTATYGNVTNRTTNDGLTTKATREISVARVINETSPIGISNATRSNITTNDALATKETNKTPPIKSNNDTHKARSTNDSATYGNLTNKTGNDALPTPTPCRIPTSKRPNDHPPTRADHDAFTIKTTGVAPVSKATSDPQTDTTIYDVPLKRAVPVAHATNDASTNRNTNDANSIKVSSSTSKLGKLFGTPDKKATHDPPATASPYDTLPIKPCDTLPIKPCDTLPMSPYDTLPMRTYDTLPKTKSTESISPTLATNDATTPRSTNDTLKNRGIYDTLPTKARNDTSKTIKTKDELTFV